MLALLTSFLTPGAAPSRPAARSGPAVTHTFTGVPATERSPWSVVDQQPVCQAVAPPRAPPSRGVDVAAAVDAVAPPRASSADSKGRARDDGRETQSSSSSSAKTNNDLATGMKPSSSSSGLLLSSSSSSSTTSSPSYKGRLAPRKPRAALNKKPRGDAASSFSPLDPPASPRTASMNKSVSLRHLSQQHQHHHQQRPRPASPPTQTTTTTTRAGTTTSRSRSLVRGHSRHGMKKREQLVAISQLGHGSFGRVYLVAPNRSAASRVASRKEDPSNFSKADDRRNSRDRRGRAGDDDDDDDVFSNKQRASLSALKTIPLATLNSRKKLEHVAYERKVAELLSEHPNVIELRGAWRCPNALYLLTEVAWGGELFRHLQHKRRFSPREAAFFAAEILSALSFAHRRRVVYRDLKPENVLLDRRGRVKLVDFGLSKILTTPTTTTGTTSSHIQHMGDATKGCRSLCGTPEYMAPETLCRREYGQAVDYWALGMLTAELLSGLPPWYTNDRDELFRRIRFDPLDLSGVGRAVLRTTSRAAEAGDALQAASWDCANEATDFVAKLLDRDPHRRFRAVTLRSYHDNDDDDFFGGGGRGRQHTAPHAFLSRFGYDDERYLRTVSPPYDPAALANAEEHQSSSSASASPSSPSSSSSSEAAEASDPQSLQQQQQQQHDAEEHHSEGGLVASLASHFGRAPLVSLTLEDISADLAKQAPRDEIDDRSRRIQAWTLDDDHLLRDDDDDDDDDALVETRDRPDVFEDDDDDRTQFPLAARANRRRGVRGLRRSESSTASMVKIVSGDVYYVSSSSSEADADADAVRETSDAAQNHHPGRAAR